MPEKKLTKNECAKSLFLTIYGALIDIKYHSLSHEEVADTVQKIVDKFKKDFNIK